MSDIDKILKAALFPTKYPSEDLNKRIKKKMKESGEMKSKNKSFMIAAAIIICVLILPTSVYAAYQYLMPKEAANEMLDEKLGDAFEKEGTEVLQTVIDGSYKVTFLGHVTGDSISERTGSSWELHPERTYVAVAIENTDGTDMTVEAGDNLFISPLIQGLRPWSYNIASMNGSYMGKVIDGVLYRIIECDNIEIFADKKLYLAVSDTMFYSNDAFVYDEESGLVSTNEAYKGTNILFDLKLDSSKADSQKAETYLKQLEEEWNSDSDTQSNDSTQGDNTKEDNNAEKSNTAKEDTENPRVQQEVFTDKENGISIFVKDNDSSRWWANETKSGTALTYHFEVEGDGVESLSYTLNKGEFCNNPINNLSEREFYGNQCSLSYDEQKERNYQYSIIFSAKFEDYGYDVDYIKELGEKDLDARSKIEYEVLGKEIASTSMNLQIKMTDGRIIEKILTFNNVLNDEIGGFWIAINVE